MQRGALYAGSVRRLDLRHGDDLFDGHDLFDGCRDLHDDDLLDRDDLLDHDHVLDHVDGRDDDDHDDVRVDSHATRGALQGSPRDAFCGRAFRR